MHTIIVFAIVFACLALFAAPRPARRGLPTSQRQSSDVFGPLSAPPGPVIVGARWLEGPVALELEFDSPIMVTSAEIPNFHVRDANGVPLRAVAPISQHTGTVVRIKCGFDPDSDATQAILSVSASNLGLMIRDSSGNPANTYNAGPLTNVVATGKPTVIDAVFNDGSSPEVTVFVNTACEWGGGAGDIIVARANGEMISNTGNPAFAAPSAGVFIFRDFGPEVTVKDPGTINVAANAFHSLPAALDNDASEAAWIFARDASSFGPYIIQSFFDLDTFVLELTFSEDVALYGPCGNRVTLQTADGAQFVAVEGMEAVDEVVTIQMGWNRYGAASPSLMSTNGIGAAIRSATTGRTAQDVTAAVFNEEGPLVGPQLLGAYYHVGSGLVDLIFNVGVTVSANPATATELRCKKPGGANTLHNAVGLGLLAAFNTITGITIATIDNTIPCDEATVTSNFAAGHVHFAALDAVPFANFPLIIVA